VRSFGVPTRPLARIAAPLCAVVVVAGALGIGYVAGTHASGSGADAAAPTASGPAAPGTTADPDHLKAQPIDVGFAEDMIDHHDQAVQMSLLAIDKATTDAVRTLAVTIATAQRRESGMLTQFLRDRGIDLVDPERQVMGWMGEPTPHDRMPGLATPDQMLALTNATGPDVDRLFIQLMITHHEGGVHMATFARDHAESQSIRDLAGMMVVDQQNELNDLHQLQGS
jgi:uncharacterized protein (DUF305 family)